LLARTSASLPKLLSSLHLAPEEMLGEAGNDARRPERKFGVSSA
jgi:hypothetical protein